LKVGHAQIIVASFRNFTRKACPLTAADKR
jgi:hypothetical protein